MKFIDITAEYGIVLRRESLRASGLTLERISEELEFEHPLDVSEDLVSYGPCFGGEAADEFMQRLECLGLKYVDDFFIFFGDFPDWCRFGVGLAVC